MIQFKVGDKLEALYHHKEEYGLEYVTITSINKKTKVYHWEADNTMFDLGGKISSGYFFHEAKAYKTPFEKVLEATMVPAEYLGKKDENKIH
jgi:hypothetical protein